MDAIAFDVILPVQEHYPLLKKISYTSANWAYTNWKGMTFGMLLAAGFLSLLRLITLKSSENMFLNVLKGAFLGAPLGVCVNCSTPIMQGLHRSGVKLESLLATLMSSPTLNIIVLTMSFSLLPFEMALTKLIAVLLFIFLIIPLIVKGNPVVGEKSKNKLLENEQHDAFLFPNAPESDVNFVASSSGIFTLLVETLKDYIKHLVFIIKIALPLMLLAGLLGAVMIELVPLEKIQTLNVSFFTIVLVGFIGTFLPVPIAMDVLLASILVSVGLATKLTGSLLFTLGIFSIYPFMVIWRDVSRRVAISLFIGVMLSGIATGYFLDRFQTYEMNKVSESFNREYSNSISAEQLIDQKCTTLLGAENASLCKRDYIIHRLEFSNNQEFCDSFKAKKYHAFCMSRAKYFSVVNDAVENNNADLCDHLNHPKIAYSCKHAAVNKLVAMGRPLTICDHLDKGDDAYFCKRMSFLTHLIQYSNKNTCQAFDKKEQSECLKMSNIVEHTRSVNFDDCMRLSTEKDINYCKSIIAEILLRKNQGIT
ncbi:MAG: permease, partial [Putridiphycobacter sp.]|nr:permease [Putridiphycobacter sp.]